MKNKQMKNKYQIILFDIIEKTVPEKQNLVHLISDLLNISVDAAYRRIRGVKLLDLEELLLLSSHFKISLDALTNVSDTKNIQSEYTPLDGTDMKNYMMYLKDLSNSIENIRSSPSGELIFSAVDIPVFHYSAYKELTFLRLFSWSSSVCGFKGSYEKYVKGLDIQSLSNEFEKIFKNYCQCPSTEIWAEHSIDRIMGLLNYHHEMGHFEVENFPLFLCEQLLDWSNTLHHWTDEGTKGPKKTPFKFYVSEIDLCNNFVLYKKNGIMDCDFKLFTVNHLDIFDQRFCRETEKWLNSAIEKSTLISGSAEKQRYKFFNRQRQKISAMMDKILAGGK